MLQLDYRFATTLIMNTHTKWWILPGYADTEGGAEASDVSSLTATSSNAKAMERREFIAAIGHPRFPCSRSSPAK